METNLGKLLTFIIVAAMIVLMIWNGGDGGEYGSNA